MPPNDRPSYEILASRGFTSWLAEQQISLAFTTYQAGKLFLLGRKPNEQLGAFERTFERTMGLWADGQTLWLSSVFQIWRFQNALLPDQHADGFDRLYVPQVAYTTGDIDVHDMAVDEEGRLVFVNTLFSCLATVSPEYSFTPLWQPPFISKLAAEDRCHLNGLAMENGRPRYVTACSQSDVADGWRDHRHGGGCVVDVDSGQIVCEGLSMPHSPRLHQDRLWLLDSGTGFLGHVDRAAGKFEPVTFCPGYARGLTFCGDYAIVGLSKCRQERTFSELTLDDNLRQRQAEPRCGLHVINLLTGDTVHWARLEGVIEELYDVVVLPGVQRPKAVGFKTDEIRRNVWFEQDGRLTSWTGSQRP
ncbi:MAG: TIGR03032 family protein [Planctomycetales bacterium]|nr:TIGR03032 family protein [Planctomycetales bacterium]NIM09455.1 TIGR03032 family protein [Planctomycetales bacterium]NIN08937.1 TIGR03032 family protein [Planctomycetales bacterium]NIN78058.1 TIGR03032 family protein [Planctomycetales bacterium]NIO35236.1 TIGR03032 family protein [Planctomycetales bacterium]